MTSNFGVTQNLDYLNKSRETIFSIIFLSFFFQLIFLDIFKIVISLFFILLFIKSFYIIVVNCMRIVLFIRLNPFQ